MSEKSPGQAAYEAHYQNPAMDFREDVAEPEREHWEAAAQAAIDVFLSGDSVSAESIREAIAAAEREPQPAPDLAAAMAALQRDLADAEAEIGRWPRCPSGCRCRVGTNDADALECGCDGPCTTGWDAPAAQHDQLRDRLATLAASLDADALATQPSKKSQIQADAARRIREALA